MTHTIGSGYVYVLTDGGRLAAGRVPLPLAVATSLPPSASAQSRSQVLACGDGGALSTA